MIGLVCSVIFSMEVHHGADKIEGHVKNLLYSLMFEHVFAYACDYFRKWEIARCGQLDMHGVYRAKYESLLKIFEIVLDCLIIGFSLNHIFMLTKQ